MNPRAFFEKLVKGFQAKGGGDATRFALKEILLGGATKKKHWQGRKLSSRVLTSAEVKRKHLRQIQRASRRRNRAA